MIKDILAKDPLSKNVLIVVRSGPYSSFQGAEGLRHANGALAMGFRPVFVLIDDGVYLSRKSLNPEGSPWLSMSQTLKELIARGFDPKKGLSAQFYLEKESLVKRGLDEKDVVGDIEIISHRQVSELLASHSIQLIF